MTSPSAEEVREAYHLAELWTRGRVLDDEPQWKTQISVLSRHSRSLEAKLEAMTAERDAARAECLEQARLNGMGSEREARLMAEVERMENRMLSRGDAPLRAEVASLRAQIERKDEALRRVQAVVDDMPDNECTCGADDGDNLGSGGQETGCYMHELIAALSPTGKPIGEPE